jgi:hypothetical protein
LANSSIACQSSIRAIKKSAKEEALIALTADALGHGLYQLIQVEGLSYDAKDLLFIEFSQIPVCNGGQDNDT